MDDNFLEISSPSMLVFEPRKHSNIVIGVPHHAPAGVTKLPCAEHGEADENVGFIGRYIAETLGSASIVACNYPIDVNKSLATDYSRIIASLKPQYLIEIHGHGNKLANFKVEISSGKKERTISETFANAILEESWLINELKDITISGNFDEIYFRATGSPTITTDSWTPLHIVLPPELRFARNNKSIRPPAVAYVFADCIVKAVRKVCI